MVSRRQRFAIWWRGTGIPLRMAAVIGGALLLALLVFLQRPRDAAEYAGSNLVIFVFINLAIIFLCALIFLVGRNVVKLIFDRRQQILGSKLRLKLVSAFVALVFLPTVMLFLTANQLLSTAMEGWFGGPVEDAVGAAVEVAKEHYSFLKDRASLASARVRGRLEALPPSSVDEIKQKLEKERDRFGFYGARIYRTPADELVEVHHASASVQGFEDPPVREDALTDAFAGKVKVTIEEKGANQFIRTYAPITVANQKYVLLTSFRVSPDFARAMAQVNDSRTEYQQLKFFKGPLRSGYILVLSVITGLILFSAIWAGFYIARQISGPVQELAEAADAVSKGNYSVQIRAQGDDELGFLVRKFNQMTSDLKRTSNDAEARRRLIEVIVDNLAVGVIALDREGKVILVNEPAQRMFELQSAEDARGKNLEDALPPHGYEVIAPLLLEGAGDREREIRVLSEGRDLRVLFTVGEIRAPDGATRGMVLLFDDVTELSKAQSLAAWREVARRIAHEIKNPLTPIQLSAQRIERVMEGLGENSVITECTQTIVEHVDSIKRLANEFSNFARMPEAEIKSVDLNAILAEAISPFAGEHSDISFQLIPEEALPLVGLDREQIRRVIINLLDNAIGALRQSGTSEARVVVKSRFDSRRKIAIVEVNDNGPGIADSEKSKIFEPYYTTKKGGTGLGLAIVSTIIAEHQGTIRVYNNQPHGSRFVVELPLEQRAVTQRRFSV